MLLVLARVSYKGICNGICIKCGVWEHAVLVHNVTHLTEHIYIYICVYIVYMYIVFEMDIGMAF